MSDPSRRATPRMPVQITVKVTTETFCTKSMMTKDLSDGGLFITDTDLAHLPIHTPLTVQADDMENAPLINARIAWSNDVGAGIEYLLESSD